MTTKPLWNKADIVTPFDTMKKFEGVTLSRIEGGQDKSFIEKKKHLAVRRLNYVYNTGAPNGSVPHNICSTEKILLAGN